MRKKALRSLTILTLLAGAFSITAWAVSLFRQQGDRQVQDAGATKYKTLRELARERDVETEVPEGEFNSEYGSLRALAQHARAVVIGRITGEESSFDGDDSIFTSYSLDVRRILKDKTAEVIPLLLPDQERPAPLATPLKFVRSGGVVHVDGHRVSRKLRGSEALKPGQDYVLFFFWSPNFKAYRLVGGVSGAFLIEDGSRIKPLGAENGMRRHDGMSLEALVEEVLAAQQN